MKTAKILSFTTLVAMAMGAGSVSLAEEVKDSSTSTEIVSVEGSDLRNEDALRVAVGDFDDVEFLLSAEEMEAIADNVHISLNGVSAQDYERSVASMFFSGEASEQIETTENSSTTFSGALTLASATSEMVTTSVSSVAMSMSSDNSTEQYATDAGKSYYEQVSTSNSGSAVTTYSATSFLGNSNSVGDGNGGYGTSTIDSGIVPYAASLTWKGGNDGNKWGGSGNWSGYTWESGDNATFNASADEENRTVTVDDVITASSLTVVGNTNYTFEYSEGASLTVTGDVKICNQSNNTSLTINGGKDNVFSGSVFICGGSSSTGTLNISDGTNTFSGSVYIGGTYKSTVGTLNIGGGTNTFSSDVYIGHGESSTGTLNISDGTNTFLGHVYVAATSSDNISGVLTIGGGENTFSGHISIGYNDVTSYGTVTITGGTTTIKGTTTIENNNCSLSVSGGTVYLETMIGTSAKGTVAISNNANIVLSGALLEEIATKAETGEAVAVITANTITFGSETFSSTFEDDDAYNTLINQYISAEGYTLTWKWDGSTLWVINAVAPEPSMFGLFFGLGAIGLVATRRRRRRKA